jgi:uncharacterized protein (DUF2141 family)
MTRSVQAILVSLGALALPLAAAAAPLDVSIEGVEARGGTFYISVQTEAQFMQDDGVAGAVIEDPDAGELDFSFDLKPGAYAVTVWHDDNGNGTFDTGGQWGEPLDGWTMPNALALRAEPTFEDVRITVGEDGAQLSLPMYYGR